jgi:amino acid adenylation domain-containing protein
MDEANTALLESSTSWSGTGDVFVFPVSFNQQQLWFLHKWAPDIAAYNLPVAYRLHGALNLASLRQSLNEIVRRHESLRTTFGSLDDQTVQRIAPALTLDCPVIDLEARPNRELDLQRLVKRAAQQPFNLETGPLARATVFRLADDDHVLSWTMHHIVSDDWSWSVFVTELRELYEAFSHSRPSPLPALSIQYADHAVSQREWLTGQKLDCLRTYWKRQLADLSVLELATDRPRPKLQSYRGAVRRFSVSPELTAALKALARQERATLFMTLAAAFQILLHRYSGQDDIALGVPSAGRNRSEIEGLIGFFVNTLVLRGDLSGNPTFRDLLARVRAAALDAYAHQELPFDKLVEELHLPRDTSRNPLFQVMFALQKPEMELSLAHLAVSPLSVETETAKFDLNLELCERGDQLQGSLEYSTDLFDAETIEALFDHYRNVLEHVTHDPDVVVSDIALMGVPERTKMLRTWNATRDEHGLNDTVLTLFERRALASPAAVAVQCGNVNLTYGALDEQSSRVGRYLQARGAGPETIVGICLDRSVDLVVALLGVLKAGAAYLPLDPAFPPERLAFMVEDSGARLVITDTRLRHLLPASTLASVVYLDSGADAIRAAVSREGSPVEGANLAYVLYTSGSTGRPKGVQITHRSLANLLRSMQREPGLTSNDRLLSVTTLSFDIAGLELYLPLVSGARLCLATREQATNPASLAGLIDEAAITMMQATPATWRMLLDDGWGGRPNLTILCGGEPMTRDLAARLLTRARAVWNMYGPTETTIWSTVERVTADDGPVSIGRPIANTEVYVLDRHMHPVPAGVPGELFIGGEGVARGYLNRSDLTAERFVPDPFSGRPGARLYRTGDLARFRRDGRLECLGRLDHQVKMRGFRIELGEMEAVLSSHDSVAAAVVTLRTDRVGEPRLVGYVVLVPGSPVASDGLRAYLRDRLPSYMVPSQFVVLDCLPLTPNGKVDRAALPDPQAPTSANPSSGRTASATEQAMADIWADVLNVPTVGPEEDFFNLGGHSLLAVRLMSRIEKAFGRRIALATLFEARTVRQLVGTVNERKPPSTWISLVPIQTLGSKPPFFCVHPVGGEVLVYSALAARLAPDQPFIAFRASGYDGVSKPLHSIEEQAALYAREMIAFQPDGPYYFGGYSHGGRVAIEMALQLEAMGREVAFLGIIDTTPCRVHRSSLTYLRGWLRNLPLWLWYDGRRSSIRANLDRLRRVRHRLRLRLSLRGVGYGGAAVVPSLDDVMNLGQLPAAIQELYRNDFQAFSRYRPQGRCGDLTLFRSLGRPLMGSHEPDLGWGLVTRGTVNVCHIAGNHFSILSEPDVQQLAAALRASLECAQARAGEKRRLEGSGESPDRRRAA